MIASHYGCESWCSHAIYGASPCANIPLAWRSFRRASRNCAASDWPRRIPMENWLNGFFTDFTNAPGGAETALLAMLIAFCIGHLISWTYMLTHTGLSYSQMFTASLLVLPVIVATTMLLM